MKSLRAGPTEPSPARLGHENEHLGSTSPFGLHLMVLFAFIGTTPANDTHTSPPPTVAA